MNGLGNNSPEWRQNILSRSLPKADAIGLGLWSCSYAPFCGFVICMMYSMNFLEHCEMVLMSWAGNAFQDGSANPTSSREITLQGTRIQVPREFRTPSWCVQGSLSQVWKPGTVDIWLKVGFHLIQLLHCFICYQLHLYQKGGNFLW